MSTRQRRAHCRKLEISPSRRAPLPQPMLAVLKGHSSIELAELAQAITANRSLCRRVIKAAIDECGWPALSIEQAIVLLGRERLAAQFLRMPNQNVAQAGVPRSAAPFKIPTE